MITFTYKSLDPVPVTPVAEKHAECNRTHQGIPSLARSRGGRLFAVWYAGGHGECRDNYVIMTISDDQGKSWRECYVVDPPTLEVRAFDSTLWVDPQGRLWWFWSQGCGCPDGEWIVQDGIHGVFCASCDNPDAEDGMLKWSAPRRIANGVMMNKPIVLQDGTWALPVSLWDDENSAWFNGGIKVSFHQSLGVESGCMMVTSTDNGESFKVRGMVKMNHIPGGSEGDEHNFIQHPDGVIHVYIRAKAGLAEAFSYDNGYTWTAPALVKDLPSANSRSHFRRLPSGRILRVANDIVYPQGEAVPFRPRMTAWLSEDEGQSWPYKLLLDGRSAVSYPDAQGEDDGTIRIIWDHDRQHCGDIIMTVVTEEEIMAGVATPQHLLISHTKGVPQNTTENPLQDE